MSTPPASERGFKTVTGAPKELALTKDEHDALVAKPATPQIEELALFGVPIPKVDA